MWLPSKVSVTVMNCARIVAVLSAATVSTDPSTKSGSVPLVTETVPVIVPVTGTGLAGVLTTVTGADGGTCGAPRLTTGHNMAVAMSSALQRMPISVCIGSPRKDRFRAREARGRQQPPKGCGKQEARASEKDLRLNTLLSEPSQECKAHRHWSPLERPSFDST